MKTVIFGASGGVGSHLVRQPLGIWERVTQSGEWIAALPSLPPRRILKSSMLPTSLIPGSLAKAIDSADAVISCLGARRKIPNNPWSKVTSPSDLMERFSRSLIEAMTAPGVPKRLLIVSAAGVGTSAPLIHPALRFLFDHSSVGIEYKDLAKMEHQVERSNLDWTIVRPVTLTKGKLTNKVKQCSRYGLTDSISRADVAGFLLRCLEESASNTSRTPIICTA